MAKISMLVSDDVLAEIDASAGGNRTAFMVGAALERARSEHRRREDAEIARLCSANANLDAALSREWDATLSDDLD